jgi:hypothetical protein
MRTLTSRTRRTAIAAALLTGVFALAGCGNAPGGEASRDGAVSPADLIGVWTLAGTPLPAGTVVTVWEHEIRLWRACGSGTIDWIASADGRAAGRVSSWSSRCRKFEDQFAWVEQVRTFRAVGTERELVGADGQALARLVPGGVPTPGDDILASEAEIPVATDAQRSAYAAPAPEIPEGMSVATTEQMIGTWELEGGGIANPDGSRASVEFKAEDRWGGTDGCNGTGGLWLLDADGTLVTSSGFQNLVGCASAESAPGPSVTSASAAAFDGPTLVLLGSDGVTLARLQPFA